jgi:hypothetical protein
MGQFNHREPDYVLFINISINSLGVGQKIKKFGNLMKLGISVGL